MKLCFAFLSSLFIHSVSAQVSSLYNFSQDTSAFIYNSGGNIIASGIINDQVFPGNNIGFAFNYNNTTYTQFSLSSNGYIVLGDTNFIDTYSPINNSSAGNLIAGLAGDLQLGTQFTATGISGSNELIVSPSHSGLYTGATLQGNGIFPNTTITAINGDTLTLSQNITININNWVITQYGEISYQTAGIAPYRSCTIQWRSCGQPFFRLYNDINFQIILHETSGQIETVYDFNELQSAVFWGQVGLRGVYNADFNSRTSINNWQQTQASTNNSDAVRVNSIVQPVSGLRFTWNYTLASEPETDGVNSVQFYPNPATDRIIVNLNRLSENISIEIMDLSGRVCTGVFYSSLSAPAEIYTGDLPAGIYLMCIHTTAQTVTKQIVIQ